MEPRSTNDVIWLTMSDTSQFVFSTISLISSNMEFIEASWVDDNFVPVPVRSSTFDFLFFLLPLRFLVLLSLSLSKGTNISDLDGADAVLSNDFSAELLLLLLLLLLILDAVLSSSPSVAHSANNGEIDTASLFLLDFELPSFCFCLFDISLTLPSSSSDTLLINLPRRFAWSVVVLLLEDDDDDDVCCWWCIICCCDVLSGPFVENALHILSPLAAVSRNIATDVALYFMIVSNMRYALLS